MACRSGTLFYERNAENSQKYFSKWTYIEYTWYWSYLNTSLHNTNLGIDTYRSIDSIVQH